MEVIENEEISEEPKEIQTSQDKYRMLSAISFAVMLIVIGIPLWWKTTEVHRASLPYERISELNLKGLQIAINITVYTEYPTRTNSIIRDLQNYFSPLKLYKLQIKPQKVDLETISVEIVETMVELHPQIPGQLFLVQVPRLENDCNILVSNHRIVYFTLDTSVAELGDTIKNWFLQEDELNFKILSIVSPSSTISEEKESRNRLRASLNYNIIFTVINSDPEHVNLIWDLKLAIKNYVDPLLEQISEVGEHTAKSQWLYLVDLGEKPTKTNHGTYVLFYAQLPHIITPLEKKLGSGVSKYPCVHMILYTSSCETSPLSFLSPEGNKVAGMISPQWGAIQILNPGPLQCSQNRTALIPESHEVMSVFLSQLHTLLGIKERLYSNGVCVMKKKDSLLRLWELDVLYRMRTVEHITSASLTLQSLAKLLGEISNIVINEDVAGSVKMAINAVENANIALKKTKLQEALAYSRTAYREAEAAFSNPSLLALLYFPDDQKYAVYIPLFLPIMIPVLMSLKNIYNWLLNSKKVSTPHAKED